MQLPIKQLRRLIPLVQAMMVVVFISLFLIMAAPACLNPYVPSDWSLWARELIWSTWFPVTLFSVILVGRAWCGTLCPMGALSEVAGRYGFRLLLPDWLKSPALPLITFVAVTILGQMMGVRSNSLATVMLLGGIMILAILVGLLYGRGRNRPWCRHACPIGMMLGLYGRLSTVDFRPLRRSGTPQSEGYAERGVCPTMIELPAKRSARHCIECLRCVDGSRPACGISLRHPGAEIENIKNNRADKWEVLGLFLGDGIALGGFLWLKLPQYRLIRWWLQSLLPPPEKWPLELMRSDLFPWLLRHPPSHLLDGLAIAMFMLMSMILIGVMLAALTALAAMLARPTPRQPLGQTMAMMGYQIAPIALVSLLLGLGGGLIDFGMPPIRIGLFAAAGAWSLWLGWRIMASLNVPSARRLLALLPRLASVLLLALLWSPALGIADKQVEKLAELAMPQMDEALPHFRPADSGY